MGPSRSLLGKSYGSSAQGMAVTHSCICHSVSNCKIFIYAWAICPNHGAQSGGREYCVHLYWPHTHVKSSTTEESWASYCPTSVIDFDGTHPRLGFISLPLSCPDFCCSIPRLFSMVPEALRSLYVVRQPLDDWVDQSGTVFLLGEAAHPLMVLSFG